MPIRRTVVAGLIGLAIAIAPVAVEPATAALPTCAGVTILPLSTPETFIEAPSVHDLTAEIDCVAGLGNQGGGVKALQRALNLCHHAGLVEDGIFGTKTRNAVLFLQTVAGISPDGVYGPETRKHAVKMPIYRKGKHVSCGLLIAVAIVV